MAEDSHSIAPRLPQSFATTKWSLIRAAGQRSKAEAAAALNSLCSKYWFPLYAFVRRQGYREAEAQDLTQAFFVSLLERQDLQSVDPAKGRFRSFLLASMKHFLVNDWHRQRAQKRGGARASLSLDFTSAENRLELASADHATPQMLFERQWALTLLDRVREILRSEFTQAGSAEHFDELEAYLTMSPGRLTYSEAASRLGMSEAAMKMAVHRLRRRFRDCLRREIAQTVCSSEEIDDEICTLRSALRLPSRRA